MYQNVREALEIVEAFKNISPSSLNLLFNYGKLYQIPKGEHLFMDKEKMSTLYIVVHGLVSLYKINFQGEKKVIFVLGKGKIINEVVLQGLPASISCEVFENAQVLSFPREEILKIMENDFELTKGILASLSLKTRRLYRQLKNTTNSIRADKRIAAKLWKLSRDYGIACKKGIYINMDLSITYLADMLGLRRETVSRYMKVLVQKNLVVMDKGKIIVIDQEKLAKYFKSL